MDEDEFTGTTATSNHDVLDIDKMLKAIGELPPIRKFVLKPSPLADNCLLMGEGVDAALGVTGPEEGIIYPSSLEDEVSGLIEDNPQFMRKFKVELMRPIADIYEAMFWDEGIFTFKEGRHGG